MSASNVDLKQMMFSSNSGTDIEINNHNLKDKMYQDEINQHMQIILGKFKQNLNKSPEDTMSKDELLNFLDSLLPVFLFNYLNYYIEGQKI